MIQPFVGEFLTSPMPLELSFNACSHKCSFCFALLNDPDRTFEAKRTQSFLTDYHSRKTLEARLMQLGYPILVSNRVDPLAASNYLQAIPVIRTLTELGVKISLQSRGGQGVDEVLSFLPPSVWYVSINQLDDNLRQRIEPGAPSLDSRYELIEKASAAGHRVILGLNPFVAEWLPKPEIAIKRAYDAGAQAVWFQKLHFNQRQLQAMSAKQKSEYTENQISSALHPTKADHPANQSMQEAQCFAQSLEMKTYSTDNPENGHSLFDLYTETYPKRFPMAYEFEAYCHSLSKLPMIEITFQDYWNWLEPFFPQGVFALRSYVGAVARQLWDKFKVPNQFTFKDLARIIWNNPEMPAHPSGNHFAYTGEGEALDVDENGDFILIFSKVPLPDDVIVLPPISQ